jgi:hypothetical protein
MKILKNEHLSQEDKTFFQEAIHIFWDVNREKIELDKHYRSVITRVLNFGSLEEVQKIFSLYTEEAIKNCLINPIKGDWHPRTYKAFCNLFNITGNKKAENILYRGRQSRRNTYL